jgi:hypothetical protein
VCCPSMPARGYLVRRSIRGTVSACSAFSCSAYDAASWPASRSVTSTLSAAFCARLRQGQKRASASAARSDPCRAAADAVHRHAARRPSPQPDDYLLYPIKTLAAGKGSEGQLLRASRAFPKDRPSPQSMHRWWYRQAQGAGLVGPGITSRLNMHQARHTFAMELRRVAGIARSRRPQHNARDLRPLR